MATQEESLEDIGETKEEIRKLSVVIKELETQLNETADNEEKRYLRALLIAKQDEKLSLHALLTAKQETLTALINSQQGKFHHIFPLSFLNPLDVTHCPVTLDISSSPILVMQIRKVRVDGYYCSVVVQCSRKRVSRTMNPSYVIRSISCCFHPNR